MAIQQDTVVSKYCSGDGRMPALKQFTTHRPAAGKRLAHLPTPVSSGGISPKFLDSMNESHIEI